MADVAYDVVVRYRSEGSLDAGLRNSNRAAAEWMRGSMRSVAHLSTAFNRMFDNVASKAIHSIASAAESIGHRLAHGLGEAVKEAIKFNSEMEDAKISVATIYKAHGLGLRQDMPGDDQHAWGAAMQQSSLMIQQMRRDAMKLPGEFRDLQMINAAVSTPGTAAGLDAYGIEQLAKRAMVAGAVHGIRTDVMARESAMILGGAARHSMPLINRGLDLGDLHAFNRLPAFERFQKFAAALDRVTTKDTENAFQQSWTGLTSSAKDKVRGAVGFVGLPLFNRLKEELKIFNDPDFGASDKMIKLGTSFGQSLVTAFDTGKRLILEWHQPVITFTQTLATGIRQALSPFMDSGVSTAIKSFMMDDKAFEKIEHVVASMLALRAGTGVLGMGSSVIGKFGIPAFMSGGPFAGALGPATIGLATLAVGAYGATHALTDGSSSFHEAAVGYAKSITEHSTKASAEFERLGVALTPVADALGTGFLYAINRATGWVESLGWAANQASEAMKWLADHTPSIGAKALRPTDEAAEAADLSARIIKQSMDNFESGQGNLFLKDFNTNNGEKKIEPPKVTNHNTFHVQLKVEGNEDPRRVAMEVKKVLVDDVKFDRGERDQTHPSYGRGGF